MRCLLLFRQTGSEGGEGGKQERPKKREKKKERKKKGDSNGEWMMKEPQKWRGRVLPHVMCREASFMFH